VNAWYSAHVVLFQTTAIYAVLALSFQVVLRSGVFSFASVGFFGIGAYVSANLAKHGVSGVLSMIIVFVGSAIFGYALSLPLVRLRGLYLGMVTFAFDQILIVVANNGGTYTGGPVGLFGIPFDVSTLELFIVAAICLLLVSQLERRSIGRSISVLRVDEQLARSMGVEVNRQRNFIFALSAALGGLAGVLNTFNFSTIAPGGFGFDLIVAGLTMAVVGGIGSWLGAVIGALIVVWFPQVFTFVGSYKAIVYGVLVILVVAYEPGGVLGLLQRGVRAIAALIEKRSSGGAEVPVEEKKVVPSVPPPATTPQKGVTA
jgi:branched-chain amino acid transport system permease protein